MTNELDPITDEEERRRRRRFFIWWFLGGAGTLALLIVVVAVLASNGDEDEPLVSATSSPAPISEATQPATATASAPAATAPATTTPSDTPTPEPTPGASPSPEATTAPSATPTATATATSTATATATATATPTDTPSPTPTATPTATATPAPSPAGMWRMTVNPQPIGICSSASDTASYLEDILVEIVGNEVRVTGVDGSQQDPWIGSLSGNIVTFEGAKTDGSGVTTAKFTLTYDPATERLDGKEDWDWVSQNEGSCVGGTSTVTSVRL